MSFSRKTNKTHYDSGYNNQQLQQAACSQCGVLMLANEKLIGRMKKYEMMLRYKNKSGEHHLNNFILTSNSSIANLNNKSMFLHHNKENVSSQ